MKKVSFANVCVRAWILRCALALLIVCPSCLEAASSPPVIWDVALSYHNIYYSVTPSWNNKFLMSDFNPSVQIQEPHGYGGGHEYSFAAAGGTLAFSGVVSQSKVWPDYAYPGWAGLGFNCSIGVYVREDKFVQSAPYQTRRTTSGDLSVVVTGYSGNHIGAGQGFQVGSSKWVSSNGDSIVSAISEEYSLNATALGTKSFAGYDGTYVKLATHTFSGGWEGIHEAYAIGGGYKGLLNFRSEMQALPVPEPSSIIALLGGLVGLFGLRRRRA